jgi:hypothetical protein
MKHTYACFFQEETFQSRPILTTVGKLVFIL